MLPICVTPTYTTELIYANAFGSLLSSLIIHLTNHIPTKPRTTDMKPGIFIWTEIHTFEQQVVRMLDTKDVISTCQTCGDEDKYTIRYSLEEDMCQEIRSKIASFVVNTFSGSSAE